KRTHEGQTIPRIVFTKGGGLWLDEMGQLDCDVIGLDWTVNLGHARQVLGGAVGGPGKALQGNIDPNVLFAKPAQIETEVERVLGSFGPPHQSAPEDPDQTGPTHIFNLGHGISQHTPPENVAALIDAVHSRSARMRG
ncbi:MAG: uroporphyrinogen decarboxylase family protein, partial [Burkholderiaceae bacterium]